jgi:hypothetical protein
MPKLVKSLECFNKNFLQDKECLINKQRRFKNRELGYMKKRWSRCNKSLELILKFKKIIYKKNSKDRKRLNYNNLIFKVFKNLTKSIYRYDDKDKFYRSNGYSINN